MPGEILKIKVKEGDVVEKGDTLAVLSAMKMEMMVTASIGGTVKSISAEVGMKLEGNDLIMDIE